MPWKTEMTKSLIPVCGNTYTSSSTDITRKTRNPSCSGWKASFAYFCSSGPGMMIHTKHCKYQVKCSILIDFSPVLRRRVTLFFLLFFLEYWNLNTYKCLKPKFDNVLKPNSGIRRLNPNWGRESFWISFQVQTFWHWFDYLCQQAHRDGKEICVVNIDETSIHRCALRSKGYVTKNNLGRPPARFINRSLKRGTATHVAAISHLPPSVAAAIHVLEQADRQSQDGRPLKRWCWFWSTSPSIGCCLFAS